ncbi:SH3 domain-containing protein [Wukongibacter baidiensis]|uniref:C40 family peptidase n=1 Tax=Wukongibacter baidiensis TaxID=1723361 RepID=UPI003D7F797E
MMKHVRVLLTITISLMCIFAMTFMVYGEETAQGVIIGNDVNIRSMPNTESEIVDKLLLGNIVEVLSNQGSWYSIRTDSKIEGWILNDLIVVDQEKDPIKTGVITTDNLNVRKEPSTESDILHTLSKKAEVTIIAIQEDWYQISIGESEKGWLHSDYVEIKPNYSRGRIIGDNVNVRSENSIDSEIVCKLDLEAYVHIKGYSNEWYNVLTYDGQEGWIHKDFVSIVFGNNGSSVSRGASRTSMKIVQEAKKVLGVPYKYGSNGPKSFDCSGFTTYVFKKCGIELPRTSRAQAKVGKKVSKSDLQVGDLVFFDTSGSNNGAINHVGIYIGSGSFIHASSGKKAKKVVISDITTGFYQRQYVTARRVF